MEARFTLSKCQPIEDVDKAPEQKGIYAWYARLNLGKAVYDDQCAGGSRNASEQTLKALREHTAKHQQQPLKIAAVANFSVEWSGSIGSSADDFTKESESPEAVSESSLQNVVSSSGSRLSFLHLLTEAFPVFSSPLYIGLAIDQSLRKRLMRHKHQFMSCWMESNKDPAFADRIQHPKNFAERAIKVGFMPRDLCFFTLHLEHSDSLTDTSQNELIRSAELLLNRWANPILGRR